MNGLTKIFKGFYCKKMDHSQNWKKRGEHVEESGLIRHK